MKFDNSYVTLGERFFHRNDPTEVDDPQLFLWNHALAKHIGVTEDLINDKDTVARIFAGNQKPEGAEPISTAYAGHQFGSFNPQLGDGRAHLLGEILTAEGERWDLQLKGSGTSAYSRGGDGRCAIGPAVREFIMSEAMHALGVPTTRCLAVVTTGEKVFRQGAHPGAVVTRLATSHLRVGTFQFFAARKDADSLSALCDFAIERHYPEVKNSEKHRCVALLDRVIENQIRLIVEWMRVGFIHGVMNTDNTAISGETIDFGPCAMMGVYDLATVYSSIDHQGRYAFGNQPHIAHWNMARFAESLLPLLDTEDESLMEELTGLINNFPERFQQAHRSMVAAKCGLLEVEDSDDELMDLLLQGIADAKLDYTISFDLLTRSVKCEQARGEIATQLGEVIERWHQRISTQDAEQTHACLRRSNPVVIPRNHHVEAVLQECEESGDPASALKMLDVLRQPYTQTEQTQAYQTPPEDGDRFYETFCGT
jgi:uncharacterized protein YdiU (UPF0061 family)